MRNVWKFRAPFPGFQRTVGACTLTALTLTGMALFALFPAADHSPAAASASHSHRTVHRSRSRAVSRGPKGPSRRQSTSDSILKGVGKEDWYGLFFGSGPIGYASMRTRKTIFHGSPTVQVDSQTSTTVKLLGVEVSQQVSETDLYTAHGDPISSDLMTSSSGHNSHVTAAFHPHEVTCLVGDGSDRLVRHVPIPAGVHLGSDDNYSVDPAHLRKGAHWSEWYFDPATLAVEKFSATVVGPQSVKVDGQKRASWKVDGSSVIGDMTLFVNQQGDMLRMDMPLGIYMVKESRAAARGAADYHPSADLAKTGAVASNVIIEKPRSVNSLELVMSGVPAGTKIPSGDGQVAVPEGGGKWRLTIHSTSFSPGGTSGRAPIRIPESGPGADLASTAELTAANPAVQSTARTVLAGETDAQKAVALLHDWVNTHMQARYDIGVLRSGTDILNDRVGVCRDYAVLYASLARAAGIPTRICSGLVYWHGQFYYHAWAESYVGKWARVDPTMPTEFVDATHVTLARGDARSMFRIVGLVGLVRIEVVKFGTGP